MFPSRKSQQEEGNIYKNERIYKKISKSKGNEEKISESEKKDKKSKSISKIKKLIEANRRSIDYIMGEDIDIVDSNMCSESTKESKEIDKKSEDT